MKPKKIILFLCLFITYKVFPQNLNIEWHDNMDVKSLTLARIVSNVENDMKLISILSEIPNVEFDSALELNPDGSESPANFFNTNSKRNIILQNSVGKIIFIKNKVQQIFKYNFESFASNISLDPNCNKFNLNIKINDHKKSIFPGYIFCHIKDDEIVDIVFSSLSDAQWYGANVKISEGKGERWKKFLAVDVVMSNELEISWGDLKDKNTVRFNFNPPQKGIKSENQQIKFQVGSLYSSGVVSKNNADQNSYSELKLPLQMKYALLNSNIYLAARGDLTVLNFEKLSSKDVDTSLYEFKAGYRFDQNKYILIGELGYLFQTLDYTGIGVSSKFISPELIAKIIFNIKKIEINFSLSLSGTENSGSFFRNDYLIEFRSLDVLKSKLSLVYNLSQIKANANDIFLNSKVQSIGLNYQF